MNRLLRESVGKIVNGILFGIGFGLIVGLIYFLVSDLLSGRMMRSLWNDAALEKVVIKSHEEVKRGNDVLILGTIENQGTESVRMPTIQVDLFDKTGKFVDQCSGYSGGGSLQAGEARNFKASCGSKDHPVAEHDSYKLRVVGL